MSAIRLPRSWVILVCSLVALGVTGCGGQGRLTSESTALPKISYSTNEYLPQISAITVRPVGRAIWSKTLIKDGWESKFLGYIETVSTAKNRVRIDTFTDRVIYRREKGTAREIRLGAILLSSVELEPTGAPYKITVPDGSNVPTQPPTSSNLSQQNWNLLREAFVPPNTVENAITQALERPIFPEGPVAVGIALTPQSPSDYLYRMERYVLPAAARGGIMPGMSWDEYQRASKRMRQQRADEFVTQQGLKLIRSDIKVRGSVIADGLEYLYVSGSARFSTDTGSSGEVSLEMHIDPYSGFIRYAAVTSEAKIFASVTSEAEEVYYTESVLVDLPSIVPQMVSVGVARPQITSPSAPGSITQIYRRAVKSVVTVEAGSSSGTGFVVSGGYVVTNHHVVEGETAINLLTSSGQNIPAQIVGLGEGQLDLALLRPAFAIDAPALPLLDGIPVTGSQVLVIGSPLGFLTGTLTAGVVGSIRRAHTATWVQVDAAINPGNSGGPILNTLGQVIAVATFRLKGGEGNLTGLGFGISSRDVIAFVEKAGAFHSVGGRGPAPSGKGSVEERLTKLKELFDKGLISKEEHEKKRSAILESL